MIEEIQVSFNHLLCPIIKSYAQLHISRNINFSNHKSTICV